MEPEIFCSLWLKPWCHLGEWEWGDLAVLASLFGKSRRKGHPGWWSKHSPTVHGESSEIAFLLQAYFANWDMMCYAMVRLKWSFSLEVQREISFPGVSVTHLSAPLHRIKSDGVFGLCGGHTQLWGLQDGSFGHSTPYRGLRNMSCLPWNN